MNNLEIIKNKFGFIAALDQSGGSSKKTLKNYGIDEDEYTNDLEMFNLINDMRVRIITSDKFNNDKILGVILFSDTINRKIDNLYISDYLLNKGILPFLKIDKGLNDVHLDYSLMKDIDNIDDMLSLAKERNITGTKMRSLINEYNEDGIRKVLDQQFYYAEIIWNNGLIPIIEPEVSINSNTKSECEKYLKNELLKYLDKIDYKVILKLTIPDIDNLYEDIINHSNVIRVIALSGGYSRKEACNRLSKNKKMIASFSRSFLEGLSVFDSEEEFNSKLEKTIDEIYEASVL